MSETSGTRPEQEGPKQGEALRSPESLAPHRRVIDFVQQTAVFEGGGTRDVVKSGVLTNMIAGGGLVLRSKIIDTSPELDMSEITHSIEVAYPGGCTDSIDIDEDSNFTYIFGGDGGGMFSDLDEQERDATTSSFFIRYNLDYYAQHPELWRPEVL